MQSLRAKIAQETSKNSNMWNVPVLTSLGVRTTRQTAKIKLLVRVKFYDPKNRD